MISSDTEEETEPETDTDTEKRNRIYIRGGRCAPAHPFYKGATACRGIQRHKKDDLFCFLILIHFLSWSKKYIQRARTHWSKCFLYFTATFRLMN